MSDWWKQCREKQQSQVIVKQLCTEEPQSLWERPIYDISFSHKGKLNLYKMSIKISVDSEWILLSYASVVFLWVHCCLRSKVSLVYAGLARGDAGSILKVCASLRTRAPPFNFINCPSFPSIFLVFVVPPFRSTVMLTCHPSLCYHTGTLLHSKSPKQFWE